MNAITRCVKLVTLSLAALIITACASTGPNYAEYIIGEWETDINGMPIDVTVTESTINLMGITTEYALQDNVLTFDFQGPQVALSLIHI